MALYKTYSAHQKKNQANAIFKALKSSHVDSLNCLLKWKLVKAGKRVLLIYHPNTIYYDGQGGVLHWPEGSLPSSNELSFWSADLWCLFDAKGKKEEHLSAFPYEYCTFVLSTSPRREMVNDFKKPPPPQIFYMPLWNEAELTTIANLWPMFVR